MQKKLELYFSSFKASACAKPTALIMFILLIIVVTIVVAFPLRMMLSALEEDAYYGELSIRGIEKKQINFQDYKSIGDKIRHINDKNLFDKQRYRNNIMIKCNKPNIIINDEKHINERELSLFLEIEPDLFTQQEINKAEKKYFSAKVFLINMR